MKVKLALLYVLTLILASICSDLAIVHAADAIPSWNDGKAKQSILAFLENDWKTIFSNKQEICTLGSSKPADFAR